MSNTNKLIFNTNRSVVSLSPSTTDSHRIEVCEIGQTETETEVITIRGKYKIDRIIDSSVEKFIYDD